MKARRILVVDDEPAILDLLTQILEGQGHLVDVALCAEQGLELVRQHMFDAAILDFNLPDMNGIMLHRQIRRLDEELAARTLFTSGMTQESGNLDYFQAFGRGFLPKPFRIETVVASLRELWSANPAGA